MAIQKSRKTVQPKPSTAPVAPVAERATPSMGRPKIGNRRIIRFISLSLAGFVVAVIVIFGVGLYAFGWNDQVTNMVIKVLPYPAARAGSHIVTYRDFRADITTLNHYYSNQDVSATGAVPTAAQIEELVLNRLIRDYQTKLLAKDRGVVVTNADIESRFQELVGEAGDVATIEQTLRQLYNWDISTFKAKVIEPFLYRERLQQSLAEDENLNREPKQQAEDVVQQLADGASFEDLAKQYSDDTGTATNGGDLGYFGRGVMVATFEDAAFALDVGEVSGIVQTPFGFHIIKLEDKRTQDVDGTAVDEIRARHILIATNDVDTWVTDELKTTAINSFVRNNRWDKNQGRIVNGTAESASS